MTRVHTHLVDLAVAWPSAALSDTMLATAMIAGLRELYPEFSRQFAEARVVSHSVLVGPNGLVERRSAGAIVRGGVGVTSATPPQGVVGVNGRPVDEWRPLSWEPGREPTVPNGNGHVVPVEASPPPGYRPDLAHPQPPGQDALGTPRILPAEAESLMRTLSVRVEELAIAVGWLLRQTANHTHVEASGRPTMATPPPQVDHR